MSTGSDFAAWDGTVDPGPAQPQDQSLHVLDELAEVGIADEPGLRAARPAIFPPFHRVGDHFS
jgi:hypothetical protein